MALRAPGPTWRVCARSGGSPCARTRSTSPNTGTVYWSWHAPAPGAGPAARRSMLGSRTSGQSETERSPDFRRFGPAKKPSKPWGCGSSGVRANAYLQRRLNAAFNARDPDALIAVCDPTNEVHSVFTAVGGATYQRHEGARRWRGE